MKIIYISYSCDPYNGSEDQIGFNIPVASYKSGNDVTVITKKEHEESIQLYLSKNTELSIKFVFIDIKNIYKQIFKGLLYSMRIIIWQKVSETIVKELCRNEEYDIIHQIAPIEFRAIGDYGNIGKTKYILGPIGGGFKVPIGMRSYTKRYFLIEISRNILNFISFNLLRMSKKLNKCNYILFTNEETKRAFDKFKLEFNNSFWSYHCDIGVSPTNMNNTYNDVKSTVFFLVPGRLNYRKGHNLLFDSLPRHYSKVDFIIKIVGAGPLEDKLKRRVKRDEFLKKHVIFLGRINYQEMNKQYDESNVVILPSLSEATGTVLIEAMSRSKPVITGNYFGAKLLVDNSSSWLFSGKNKKEVIKSLRECIQEVLLNPESINEKGKNAYELSKKYTWGEKVKVFNDIYFKSISKL